MMPVGCANCFVSLVPDVAEAGGLRQALDRRLLAGEEVPAASAPGRL